MPTIAVAEMAYGIEKLTAGRRREALLAALRRLVIEFSDRLFDFNVAAAWAYGRILAAARSAGQPMAVPDAAIAAIASANGCALGDPGMSRTSPRRRPDLVDRLACEA